jgi:hypothetical protein
MVPVLTTTADHNSTRRGRIGADAVDHDSQLADGTGQRGCTLQARGRWFEPSCAHQDRHPVAHLSCTAVSD